MGADEPGLKPLDPAALQSSIEGLAKDLMLPGAMVLLLTPQGNAIFGYGTTELGTTNPPRADTHFRAGSNTKTMTAAAIVQMVQEGKLGFDDPISKFVEGVPDGDKITISQLLKMRSGLFNFTNAPELSKGIDDEPDKVWTADEVLGMAFKRPPDFAPGAEYEYNNTNYYLLGLVAEKIDGKPLSAVLQDRLFGPLGMKNTVLPAATSNTIPEPYTHGYLYGSASYALADAPYPEDLQAAARAGALKPNDDTWQNPSAYFAAGAIISTADDLATWMRALVGGKVFNAEFQKQWLASPEAPEPGGDVSDRRQGAVLHHAGTAGGELAVDLGGEEDHRVADRELAVGGGAEGHDRRALGHRDRLLLALVGDHDGVVGPLRLHGREGGVGHQAALAEIPGRLALADAVHRRGEDADRDGLLAAVGGGDRGDRQIVVGLQVVDRDPAVDRHAEVRPHGHLDGLARDGLHGRDVAVDRGDLAADVRGGEAGPEAEHEPGEQQLRGVAADRMAHRLSPP